MHACQRRMGDTDQELAVQQGLKTGSAGEFASVELFPQIFASPSSCSIRPDFSAGSKEQPSQKHNSGDQREQNFDCGNHLQQSGRISMRHAPGE